MFNWLFTGIAKEIIGIMVTISLIKIVCSALSNFMGNLPEILDRTAQKYSESAKKVRERKHPKQPTEEEVKEMKEIASKEAELVAIEKHNHDIKERKMRLKEREMDLREKREEIINLGLAKKLGIDFDAADVIEKIANEKIEE